MQDVKRKYGCYQKKINKKFLKTMLLRTSRSVEGGTKENCYFGLQVSVPNPNFLCIPYASIKILRCDNTAVNIVFKVFFVI